MAGPGLWARIRQARLFRVLLLYVGASWIILQATAILRNEFQLPQWVTPFVVLLLVIGLVIICATAWVQAHPPARAREGEVPAPWELNIKDLAESIAERRIPHLTWARAILAGVVAFSLLFGAAGLYVLLMERGGEEEGAVMDPNVVAVLPFRVAGADPALGYLREGMMDLLAAKLTGEGGPRAADPRSVMSAWRRAVTSEDEDLPQGMAIDLARSLGAARVLLGGIVGTPTRIVLNATLIGVLDSRTQAQTTVDGPADSITTLVDQLTAQLLALGAGETERRLAALTSTSLPALKAYLHAQATYRRGRYTEAAQYFERALQIDSAFALAALGLRQAGEWASAESERQVELGLALAWAARDRLGPRDGAFLMALAGPRYPAPSSAAEFLDAAKRAVDVSPDRPEAWYELGDDYYHEGPLMGVGDSRELAAAAFRRSVDLDSSFTAALEHLIDVTVLAGDTGGVRRLAAVYLSRHSGAELADFYRWRVATALRDTSALAMLRPRFDEMSSESLWRIIGYAQADGVGLDDAQRAAAVLRGRAAPTAERLITLSTLHDLALNRGRPREALTIQELERREARAGDRAVSRQQILDALYWDGDSVAAREAALALGGFADGPLAPEPEERASQYADICTLEQWRLLHGQLATTAGAIARLRNSLRSGDVPEAASGKAFCAALLEAALAVAQRQIDAAAAVHRLDSLLQTAPPVGATLRQGANLVAARLWQELGDATKALAAVRRREYGWSGGACDSSRLREEGRLAALTGDREGAIRAYRHYLALRSDPEATLAAEVEHVRAELATLAGEQSLE